MRNEKKAYALLLALCIAAAIPISAQGAEPSPGQGTPAVEPAIAAGYRIGTIRFEIEGRTKERFLREKAEIEEGRTFAGKAALDAYLGDRAQLLVNERTIESASIEPVFGPADPAGIVTVDLVVHARDTVNIIALPYFKYDSNDGLLLSARCRDYNFFGTMQTFKFDLNYTVDTGGDQEWDLDTSFSFPFQMARLDYTWNLDQTFGYTADGVFRYTGTAGLDLNLPIGDTKLTIGPSQTLYVRPDNDDGSIFPGWYFKTLARASYDIPLPVDLHYFGKLKANLYAGIYHFYNFDSWGAELLPERYGPTVVSTQSLYFGRIDWIKNYRRGLEANAALSESYNLDSEAFSRTASASVIAHLILGEGLGASGKLRAIRYLDGVQTDIGDDVRGVIDSRIDSDAAVFLNLEMPFTTYRYRPDEWTGISWLRYIALEQHWSPFFDMALTHDPKTGRWFDFRDGWYAAGIEAITFPYKFRSFYIRISAGWDIPTLLETKSLSGRSSRDGKKGRELYIGLGHQF